MSLPSGLHSSQDGSGIVVDRFETLGFEDCCDGHSELEIHLACDSVSDPWRVVVSGETPCLQCNPEVVPADGECMIDSASAAQCGQIGTHATCTGSQQYRLSAYPQGRIEVFNENVGGWGTVCGHWFWDNDGLADMVCRKLGYEGGTLYTYGVDDSLDTLPIVAGYRLCQQTEAERTAAGQTDLWDCEERGAPHDRDCATSSCDGSCDGCAPGTVDPGCTHSIDQGVICYHAGDAGAMSCQTHNMVDTGSCDDWHHCSDGCQTCSGCHFGCAQTDPNHPQDLLFGCVDFQTANCNYDVTNGDGSFSRALRTFAQCSGVNPQPAGYCRGSLASAAFLANHDVCEVL